MLTFELWHYILVGAVCAFAGMVDAIAGGGGLLTVPMYLGIGLNPQQTLGTNKMASTLGTLMAVYRYLRATKIHRTLGLTLFSLGFVGGVVGALLSSLQTRLSMLLLLLCLVPIIFLLQPTIDRRAQLGASSEDRGSYISSWTQMSIAMVVAFAVGSYDGFFGPGTGTLLILGFILFAGFGYRNAAIYGRLVNLSSNLGALCVFGMRGTVVLEIVIVAVFGSMIGNWLGSGIAIRKAEGVIRPVFRFVLLVILLQAAYEVMTQYW